MTDQAEPLRRMAERRDVLKKARVIAVTSGKGGVGKTNLAVNLAVCLSRLGLRTGVLDGDLGLANIDIVLGITPEFNLGHVLHGQKRLAEILVPGPEGVAVFAGGSGVYELANLSQWLLQRFVKDIGSLDADIDLLIVDTGAGISRNVMSFVLACDEVIVVTTPEVTAITDAYGVIKLVVSNNPSATVNVVVNMVKGESQALNVLKSLKVVIGQFLETDVSLNLLGYIPADAAVGKAVHEQTPFAIAYPHSKAAASVERIARNLVQVHDVRPSTGIGGLFQRMADMARRRKMRGAKE